MTHTANIASPTRFSWIVGGDRRVEIVTLGTVSIVQISEQSYAVVRDDTREFFACCSTLKQAASFLRRTLGKGSRCQTASPNYFDAVADEGAA